MLSDGHVVSTNRRSQEGKDMNRLRSWWLAGAGVLVLGGIIGAGAVMAQTPSSTPSTQSATLGAPAAASTAAPGGGTSGAFESNEDPTHEAGESAAQEAAEDSGQRMRGGPGGAFMQNEDPTHEARESPEREATEDAGQASGSSGPAATATACRTSGAENDVVPGFHSRGSGTTSPLTPAPFPPKGRGACERSGA